MTQCTQSSFEFEGHFRRDVVASFDGGTMTSDAGALLLRQVDRKMGFLRRDILSFGLVQNTGQVNTRPSAELPAR